MHSWHLPGGNNLHTHTHDPQLSFCQIGPFSLSKLNSSQAIQTSIWHRFVCNLRYNAPTLIRWQYATVSITFVYAVFIALRYSIIFSSDNAFWCTSVVGKIVPLLYEVSKLCVLGFLAIKALLPYKSQETWSFCPSRKCVLVTSACLACAFIVAWVLLLIYACGAVDTLGYCIIMNAYISDIVLVIADVIGNVALLVFFIYPLRIALQSAEKWGMICLGIELSNED